MGVKYAVYLNEQYSTSGIDVSLFWKAFFNESFRTELNRSTSLLHICLIQKIQYIIIVKKLFSTVWRVSQDPVVGGASVDVVSQDQIRL